MPAYSRFIVLDRFNKQNARKGKNSAEWQSSWAWAILLVEWLASVVLAQAQECIFGNKLWISNVWRQNS